MSRKKRWSELSDRQRGGIVTGAVAQLALQAAMLWDLTHRPAGEVRGPKALWVAASFANFGGPIAYFTVGRRRPEATR